MLRVGRGGQRTLERIRQLGSDPVATEQVALPIQLDGPTQGAVGEVRPGDADRLTIAGLSSRFTVALRFLPNFCRATDWFWLRSRNGRKRLRVRVGLVGYDAVLKNVVVRASRSSHEKSANEPNRGKRGNVNCQSTHRIAQPHYSRTA